MTATEPKPPPDALSRLRINRDEPARQRSGSGFAKVVLAFVVLLTLAGAAFLWGRSQGWFADGNSFLQLPDALQQSKEVRTARVTVEKGRSADAIVVATGYLESRRQARIGARAPGRIEVVHVEEGSRVQENDILAVLEHADMDAALSATQATLERTRAELGEQDVEIERALRDLERAQQLKPTGSINESEFDAARFQHAAAVARMKSLVAAVGLAEARVREAEQLKENMFIRAPFDGTVISKDAEVGESILPGGMGEASGRGSVVTIADLDHLEVDCDVKEDYISRVQEDRAAEVAVDAVPDKRYRGRVRKIIPMGDRARATVKVKVEILDNDPRLFPDMSSTVYFLPEDDGGGSDAEAPRVFCADSAVIEHNERTGVWVVDNDNRIQFREVSVGESRDSRVEITDGLNGGELVIADPAEDLRDGDKVSPSR